MSDKQSVEQLVQAELPEGGYLIPGKGGLFMEVKEVDSNLVWMSAEPVTFDDFDALELDEKFVKVGIAAAAMDRAAFKYSPNESAKAVLQRQINGRQYINVAIPGQVSMPDQAGGPVKVIVNKAHVLGFDAGRRVTVLTTPDGDFVEVISSSVEDESLVLPAGGVLKTLTLDEPWIVTLPSSTTAYFWFDKGMRSFQGPVTLPT